MQMIQLDISQIPAEQPVLRAKQADVGRKFMARITDNGADWPIPEDTVVSVWYSGTAGEGNYTHIGAVPAAQIGGNTVTVELIAQMLTVPGGGMLSLALNRGDGTRLGLWNIHYWVEPVPGADSVEASAYYDAFAQNVAEVIAAAEKLTLPVPVQHGGTGAQDAESARQMLGAAPAGYGLGKDIDELSNVVDANDCVKNGWYKLVIATTNGIGAQGIMRVDAEGGANIVQTAYAGYSTSRGMVIKQRVKHQGTWGEWEYVTPLCVSGIEYRTTERLDGVPVYCKVISFGTLPNNTFKNVAHGITGKTQNVRYEITTASTARMFANHPGITDVVVDGTNVKITTNQNLSDISVTFVLWYIK